MFVPPLWTIDSAPRLCYVDFVNLGERYRQLSMLGRDTFLDSVAEAALVMQQRRPRMARGTIEPDAPTDDDLIAAATSLENTDVHAMRMSMDFGFAGRPLVLPLAKKKGTPFVDLITIGRTPSNDVTLADLSVSRFQAFFRHRFGRWFLCDAGSRNGTHVNGVLIKSRTEVEVLSGQRLQFGLLETTFHTADTLFDLLASSRSR